VASVRFLAGNVEFEWNAAKASANLRKHGVSFEEAATVFLDEHARVFDDPDSSSEERFLLVGFSAASRILVVVHVERGERIRIISARKVTRSERRSVEEQ
jgi:uncharacterized DUF497 family protein